MRSSLPILVLGTSLPLFTACSSKEPGTVASDASVVDGSDTPRDAGTSVSDAAVEAAAPGYMPAGYTQEPYLSVAPERKFTAAEQVLDAARDYIAVLDTDVGVIVLDLFESDTPVTVNSFVFLARHHFYEQIAFHRVIEGFMAQTGDPKSVTGKNSTWGNGNPGYFFGTEFKPNLNFDGPGILGMARTNDPNTNGSQFFITFVAYPSLNQQYTVWGKVTEGMDNVLKIARGEPPATETATRIREARIGSKAK
ncbi:MAG: peptidylprolyl isomerase [Polyangiaceae bacterium]